MKFVRREISTLRKIGEEYLPENRCIIGLCIDGIIIPHPVTDFIDKKYYMESGSINSEKAAADILVQFLNYILKNKNEKDDIFSKVRGICDLELLHLESYLEFCGNKGNSRKTVMRKESCLLQFYYFMGIEKRRLKITPKITSNNDTNYLSLGKRRRIKSLNANLYYRKPPKDNYEPTKIKKKDFVTQQWTDISDKRSVRMIFIREFLLLAGKEVPDIAFAICLQIFGGLRSAECMNLTINAIKPQNNTKYGEGGLVVEIRDRQDSLFEGNSSLSNEQVKKPRDQAILLDPLVPYLYKKHLDWLGIKRSDKNHKEFKNQVALFLNSKGMPMRTHSYRMRFNKLKGIYLGLLRATNGRYEDFQEFRNTNWSTHICRGTFTNLCLDAGFNATQTAVMRGDSSPEAMYAYTDILTATAKITQAIEILSSPTALSELKESSQGNDLIKTWKEVLHFEKS